MPKYTNSILFSFSHWLLAFDVQVIIKASNILEITLIMAIGQAVPDLFLILIGQTGGTRGLASYSRDFQAEKRKHCGRQENIPGLGVPGKGSGSLRGTADMLGKPVGLIHQACCEEWKR